MSWWLEMKRQIWLLTFTIQTYCCVNYRDQRGFSNWNHDKCLSYLFPLHLSTAIGNIFIISVRGLSLYVGIWRIRTVPALKGFRDSITLQNNRLFARVCVVNNCLIKTVLRCSPCGVLLLKKVYIEDGENKLLFLITMLTRQRMNRGILRGIPIV